MENRKTCASIKPVVRYVCSFASMISRASLKISSMSETPLTCLLNCANPQQRCRVWRSSQIGVFAEFMGRSCKRLGCARGGDDFGKFAVSCSECDQGANQQVFWGTRVGPAQAIDSPAEDMRMAKTAELPRDSVVRPPTIGRAGCHGFDRFVTHLLSRLTVQVEISATQVFVAASKLGKP
jgi:hypothetical protein